MEKQRKRICRSVGSIGVSLCIVIGGIFLFNHIINTHHVKIGDYVIKVDVAEKTVDQERGLSGRKRMCDKCGMLFVFTQKKQRTFWMNGMLFDIDVLWINGSKIVGLQENISHKKQSQEVFTSQQPVDKVLELPAGFIAQHHIAIGQKVEFLNE